VGLIYIPEMKRLLILLLFLSGTVYSLSPRWVFYKEVGGVKVYERIKIKDYYHESCLMKRNDKGYNTKYGILEGDSLQILDVNLVSRIQNDTLWKLWLGFRIDSSAYAERINKIKCGTADYYCFDLYRERQVGIFKEGNQTIIRYFTESHNRGVWEELLFRDGKLEQINTDTLYYHMFTELSCMGGLFLWNASPSQTIFLSPYISNFEDVAAMHPHRIQIDSTHTDTLFTGRNIFTSRNGFEQEEDIFKPDYNRDDYKLVRVQEGNRNLYYRKMILSEHYSSRRIKNDTCEKFSFNFRIDGWVVYHYKKLQYGEPINEDETSYSCPEYEDKRNSKGLMEEIKIPHKVLSKDSLSFSSLEELEKYEELYRRFLEIEKIRPNK